MGRHRLFYFSLYQKKAKECFMKKVLKAKAIRRIAGIIALIAVIGFSMVACDDDSGPGGGGYNPGGNVAVTGVTLNRTSLDLAVGGSATLVATVSPSNASNKNVAWNSSNPGVASVNNGTVSAVAAGSATITVTTLDGGRTATCSVTVTGSGGGGGGSVAVTGVTLNQSSFSLAVGNTATLTETVSPSNASNKAVTWKSSNSSIASVNNGTVTAVSAGQATITVTTADGGKTATCSVTVTGGSGGNPTFTSKAEMVAWLKNQAANSPSAPYTVKLNVNSLPSFFNNSEFSGKYVILDLSDSTFTSIGNISFEFCHTIIGVILGSRVISIGGGAFRGSTGLVSVAIPDKRKMTHFTQLQG
jgi:hypothetical protein